MPQFLMVTLHGFSMETPRRCGEHTISWRWNTTRTRVRTGDGWLDTYGCVFLVYICIYTYIYIYIVYIWIWGFQTLKMGWTEHGASTNLILYYMWLNYNFTGRCQHTWWPVSGDPFKNHLLSGWWILGNATRRTIGCCVTFYKRGWINGWMAEKRYDDMGVPQ